MSDIMNTPIVFLGQSINVCNGEVQLPNLLLHNQWWANRWNSFRCNHNLFMGRWRRNNILDYWYFQSTSEELMRLEDLIAQM